MGSGGEGADKEKPIGGWGEVVKGLRHRLSIQRSDVRGPVWSVLVAWGWGSITQPREITKEL